MEVPPIQQGRRGPGRHPLADADGARQPQRHRLQPARAREVRRSGRLADVIDERRLVRHRPAPELQRLVLLVGRQCAHTRGVRRGPNPLLTQLTEPYRAMVSLIVATGLRIGELLALRWGALDLENGALTVRESVFEGTFQPPKTLRAMRTIPLGPRTAQALMAHRKRAPRTADEDLVFGRPNGDPFRESKLLARVLNPAAKRAGLGKVTWHQFRHIHSSLMSDLGVPVKIAQEQLGHASISTTLNICTTRSLRRTGTRSSPLKAVCSRIA